MCIALRVVESVPLVNGNITDGSPFSTKEIGCAIKMSGLGKRSKQRFLKPDSTDAFIKHSKKGHGGNTVAYSCFILKQSSVPSDILELFRRGIAFFITFQHIFMLHSTAMYKTDQDKEQNELMTESASKGGLHIASSVYISLLRLSYRHTFR